MRRTGLAVSRTVSPSLYLPRCMSPCVSLTVSRTVRGRRSGRYQPPGTPHTDEKPLHLYLTPAAGVEGLEAKQRAVDDAAAYLESLIRHGGNNTPAPPQQQYLNPNMPNPHQHPPPGYGYGYGGVVAPPGQYAPGYHPPPGSPFGGPPPPTPTAGPPATGEILPRPMCV
jgi:hypothetical protein